MVFNQRFYLLLIQTIISILTAPFIFSQNYNFFLDTSGNSPVFFQHISWSKEEYALFYEVAIQKEEGGYRDYRHESTEETFLNISLPPGKYRFNVLPYDLLGQSGQASEWKTFEILTAYQPSLEKFYPSAFYMENYSERALDIAGSNLLDETEVYLRNNSNSLFAVNLNIRDKNRATLFFDDENLIPGTYQIYIRNPGGLESTTDGFFVGYRRIFDLFIKLSWSPAIPVYGEVLNAADSSLYLAGAELNFCAVTTRRSFFNFGFDISASAGILNSVTSFKTDFDSFFNGFQDTGSGASWVELNFNLLLRKYFLHKLMSVTIHGGGGFSFFNLSDENADRENDFTLQCNLGLSYMLHLYDILYLEAGVNFVFFQTPESSGLIRPKLGIAWKF
ncbi:MAG: hypothetical protein FWC03_05345 [Treponema sp.]|nr:hypothetical protein [Treponema sp.]